MTKKEIILNALETVNAKLVNGCYEMTKEQFEELDAELVNAGADYSFCNNKNDESLKAIYDSKKKCKFFVVKLVESNEVNKKQHKEKSGRTVKEVGNSYVVFYQMVEGKYKVNTSMSTCEQIKVFIKGLHGEGEVQKLNIYKMGPNYSQNKKDIIPTRLSAWV